MKQLRQKFQRHKKLIDFIAICTLILIGVSAVVVWNGFEFAEQYLFDQRIRLFPPTKAHTISKHLQLIQIDQKSEGIDVDGHESSQGLGEWRGWPHSAFSSLMNALEAGSESSVGILIWFNHKEEADVPFDATTMDFSNRLFLVSPYDRPQLKRGEILHVDSWAPVEIYLKEVASLGFVHLATGTDGIYRFAQLVVTDSRNQNHYSLEVQLAADFLGMEIGGIENHWYGKFLVLRNQSRKQILRIPISKEGQMLITFAAKEMEAFQHRRQLASFIDVLDSDPGETVSPSPTLSLQGRGEFADKDTPLPIQNLKERYRKKVILVGMAIPEYQAPHPTPYGKMSDFLLRANVVNTLLTRSFLFYPGRIAQLLYLLFFYGCTIATFCWQASRNSKAEEPHVSQSRWHTSFLLFLLAILLMVFHVVVSQLLLSRFHLVFDLLSPLAFIFLCAVCVGFYLDYYQLLTQRDMIVELKMKEAYVEMAAAVRHEFKNRILSMMAPIRQVKRSLNNGEVSDASSMTEIMRKMEQSIKTAGETVDLIDNQLDYLREIPLDDSGNIGDILKEVYENHADEFKEKAISASIEIENELPNSQLNRSKLFDAFYNLVKNACEAMPEGGSLTIKADLNERKREIQVEISDTGVGIPPEKQTKIFRPFFSTKSRGLGMGLANVKHIITAHKGEISLKSKEGVGTTFTLTFPVENVEM